MTGAPPFYPGRAVPYNIVSMAVALGEKTDTLHDDWYTYDTRMRKLAEIPPEPIRRNKTYVPAIESALREVLDEDEVEGAISFIQACLRLSPDKRISAKDVWSHPWLSRANACMCGYYCKRETCGRH